VPARLQSRFARLCGERHDPADLSVAGIEYAVVGAAAECLHLPADNRSVEGLAAAVSVVISSYQMKLCASPMMSLLQSDWEKIEGMKRLVHAPSIDISS
jgi:hypothetical protein